MINYKCFTVNFVQVNSYLVWDDTREACLIDPGFSNTEEQKQFSDFLVDNNLQLVRCIATHNHFDHVLGGRFIEEKYGIKVEVPYLELTELPPLSTQLSAFGLPASSEFDFTPVPLDATEVDTIQFGHTELKILETPGHSPGHYSYYYPLGDGLVFCGDVIFCNGMGRYDLWGGSYETLMNSIRQVMLKLPEDTKVLSGHGPVTTIGREKSNFI